VRVRIGILLMSGIALLTAPALAAEPGDGDTVSVHLGLRAYDWAVSSWGGEAVVLATRMPVIGAPPSTDTKVLLAKRLRLGSPTGGTVDSPWIEAARVFSISPLRVAALPRATKRGLLVVVQIGAGAPSFWVRWDRGLGLRTATGADARGAKQSDDWRGIGALPFLTGPPGAFASVLTQPCCAAFRDRVFIGGECALGGAQERFVWVAPWRDRRDRDDGEAQDVSFLGSGNAPALFTWDKRFYCVAIRLGAMKPRRSDRRKQTGRVVGWTSPDGSRWMPWVTGIQSLTVSRMDVCEGEDSVFLACNSSPGLIDVFQMRGEGWRFQQRVARVKTGVSTGTVRKIVIRWLKGALYLFWEKGEGDKKTIVVRRIRLREER